MIIMHICHTMVRTYHIMIALIALLTITLSFISTELDYAQGININDLFDTMQDMYLWVTTEYSMLHYIILCSCVSIQYST
jgi:hypothetical protein